MDKTDLDEQMVQWAGLTHRLVMRSHFNFAKSNGLAFSQVITLRHIQKHEGIGVKELSRIIEISPAAISQSIEKLVKMDFVDRAEGIKDRRQKTHKLTEKGSQLLDEFQKQAFGWVRELSEKIPQSRLSETLDLLKIMNNTAQKLEEEINL